MLFSCCIGEDNVYSECRENSCRGCTEEVFIISLTVIVLIMVGLLVALRRKLKEAKDFFFIQALVEEDVGPPWYKYEDLEQKAFPKKMRWEEVDRVLFIRRIFQTELLLQ
ncbi:hypothetical protein R1flu_026213 [Riccia fluitans]|uniref:Uncharacterized protein n=1 Tax=Riccia fluitans TaxID=41844 RepID=A0ABD1XFB6_9MARC